jgi:hypothetical protein
VVQSRCAGSLPRKVATADPPPDASAFHAMRVSCRRALVVRRDIAVSVHGQVVSPLGAAGPRGRNARNLYSSLRIATLFVAADLTDDGAIAYGRCCVVSKPAGARLVIDTASGP